MNKNHLTAALASVATVSSKEQLPGNFRGMACSKQKSYLLPAQHVVMHTPILQLNFYELSSNLGPHSSQALSHQDPQPGAGQRGFLLL